MPVFSRKTSTQRAVQALNRKEFFKLTLGASFSNPEQIERLSFIYTLAGAHAIDIMAAPRLVTAAKEGIQKAYKWGVAKGQEVCVPLIMISIKSDEDPHFQKAWIYHKGKGPVRIPQSLIRLCPTKALQEESILVDLCIGCGLCVDERIPIIMKPLKKVSGELVTGCLENGASGIEFHLGTGDLEKFDSLYGEIKRYLKSDLLLSFTVGSNQMSPLKIREVVAYVRSLVGDRKVIFQADGVPMSGQEGDGSTLQALAAAQVVQPVVGRNWLQVSGGTNGRTRRLGDHFNIELNGVAMGTYARKVLEGIDLDTKRGIGQAVSRAKKVVESVKA